MCRHRPREPIGLRFATSCSIHQPLANRTGERGISALHVVHAQLGAVAVAEVELSHVAVEVLLAAMLVDALHAALEHAVEALDGVRVGQTAHILTLAVAGVVVSGKVLAEGGILAGFVGHHMRAGRHVRLDDRQKVGRRSALDVEGAGRTATLHKGQNRVLVGVTAMLRHVLLLADEGLVNLYDRAFTAHGLNAHGRHRLADAVRHEPSGLQADVEGPLKLAGADALLAAAQKVDGLKPHPHRDVACLEHGAHFDGERLAAGVALVEADPGGLAAHLADALVALAVVAHRTVRPDAGLDPCISGFLVVESVF